MMGPLKAGLKSAALVLWSLFFGSLITLCYLLRMESARSRTVRFYLGGMNRIMGLRTRVFGEPHQQLPVIYVANHISYLDIAALGSVITASFTPKAEMAKWPILGWLIRLNRPVFIDRRATAAGRDREEIQKRIEAVGRVIIFPEATTGAGRDILRFKSAFFSLAEGRCEERPIFVQPITLCVTDLDGEPFKTAQEQALYTWGEDTPVHLLIWRYLQSPPCIMEMHFHTAIRCGAGVERKTLASGCESILRDTLVNRLGHLAHSLEKDSPMESPISPIVPPEEN